MRITILCDNSVGPLNGTLGEHGFAALVESGTECILFDTGQGGTLLHNAQRMNRDLRRVTRVALSHGHYDHTGGLWPLLQAVGGRDVFAHPGIFARRYRVRDTGEHLSIGIPYAEEFLRGLGARFELDAGFRPLAPGIFLTGEVPRRHPFETRDSGLCCDSAGCLPDPLADDQSLVIVTPRGLVLLLGCCHAGLVNTIDLARERTGITEVYAVVGGTHLGFAPALQLDATVRALRELRVKKLFGSHCTGFGAAARFAREFPGAYHPAQVGFTLEV
jgi:7,8-dihydropterin-6-yl-methyl-4-(beta-D-ribofuranosyl)aminobenzene 5'-phosphate synthase